MRLGTLLSASIYGMIYQHWQSLFFRHLPHCLSSVLLVLLAILQGCSDVPQGGVEVVNQTKSPAEFEYLLPEQGDSSSWDRLIVNSEDHSFLPVHPQVATLLTVGVPGHCARTTILIGPADHPTITLTPHGLQLTGMEEEVRLQKLRTYLAAAQDSLAHAKYVYELLPKLPTGDSARLQTVQDAEKVIRNTREYLSDFIHQRPFSKACLIALLSDYGEKLPYLSIAEHDTLFRYTLANLASVYPETPLLRRMRVAIERKDSANVLAADSTLTPQRGLPVLDTLRTLLARLIPPQPVPSLTPPFLAVVAQKMEDTASYASHYIRELESLKPQGVQILTISPAHDSECVTLSEINADSTVTLCTRNNLPGHPFSQALQIRITPVVVMIDAKGYVHAINPSVEQAVSYLNPINPKMAGRPVPRAATRTSNQAGYTVAPVVR